LFHQSNNNTPAWSANHATSAAQSHLETAQLWTLWESQTTFFDVHAHASWRLYVMTKVCLVGSFERESYLTKFFLRLKSGNQNEIADVFEHEVFGQNYFPLALF